MAGLLEMLLNERDIQMAEIQREPFVADRRRVPSSLYTFCKIKDMNHLEEVKLLINVQVSFRELLKNMITDWTKENGEGIEYPRFDMGTVGKHLPEHCKENNFQFDHGTIEMFFDTNNRLCEEYVLFSITGGRCRNILLNYDVKTDIDIACHSVLVYDILSTAFKRVPSRNTRIPVYEILDNTMHAIPDSYTVRYEDDEERIKHVFIDPLRFDFTINCACISTRDGWMYAPIATLHDIQHKTLRATCQLLDEYSPVMLFDLCTLIRALRFTLKYDLVMHNEIYNAIKVFFTAQRDLKLADDYTMYHALKHLYDDDKSLRDEFYSILKRLKAYETENYSTFDEYFSYIEYKKDNMPRVSNVTKGNRIRSFSPAYI